jgi:hypothetical protein
MSPDEARRFGLAMSRGYFYVDEVAPFTVADFDRVLEGMVVRQSAAEEMKRAGTDSKEGTER